MKILSGAIQGGLESYGKAGAIAQETLGNIRTVHMFNSIQHFIKKYEQALEETYNAGIKKGLAVGWGTGLMFFTVFCTYACGMFYGAVKVSNDMLKETPCTGDNCYDGGRVLTVFFCIIMGAMALGQAGPGIQALFAARAAAYDVFQTIYRKSHIDPVDESGKKLDKVHGKIEVEDISFAYPSRPEVMVCKNYSLTIEAGETVALVGPSGSGKSTIVSLLERFYDPLSGNVKLDGVNIKEMNVKWLRQQVGLVGQEPALFATSILENIRHGCPTATDEQVYEAAKMANAYNFIKDFPRGFATEVGERGTQLSGGQKQRIAIARAIIKNPPILLLDEATSALDTESERIVQESLDHLLATSKRTTVIIAHRLSTIRDADRIAVHNGGKIVEIGSHDELMKIEKGQYRMLVEAQARAPIEEKATNTIEESLETMPTSAQQQLEPSDSVKHQSSKNIHTIEKKVETENESDDPDKKVRNVPLSRLWKLSLPEWKFMIIGGLGTIVNAAIFPVWGILLSKMTVLFFDYTKTKSEMRTDARYWSLGFIGLGVVYCLSIVMANYGSAVISQRLISRVRLMTFRAMLKQEIGWFDLDKNASGALISRLATDSATLQAMTYDMLSQGLTNITTLGIGFGIAFYYSWQMTLAMIASLPILVSASYVQAQMMSGTNNNKQNNEADAAAGSLLSESIGSIRTVASFSMENSINGKYVGYLDQSKTADIKVGLGGGLAFGVSQGVMFFNLAFLFWLGGELVKKGKITFEDMFTVIMVIIFSTFAVGLAAQNMTDTNKARKAATNVFGIVDRIPPIDATSMEGETIPIVQGNIEFKSVSFSYPSRQDAQIYKNYNLSIKSGQTVALVGASGSGKSTAISLVERFYDPTAGTVSLDGKDLRKLSLHWLRDNISLVSQEPVLFAGTIGENIAMGKPGATREEIIEAAKMSNAHDFICNFPLGYDTEVGDRGAQISGGQKQRIAIARAILRDPAVLLLDEATSALDNESERVVQESLDRLLAMKQRTTIVVAHRLTTIRNADLIAVTHEGAIVEQGTHDELMQIEKGVYKALVSRQMKIH
jgi:ATP-binding cassette subfamily B (MDR/TAP) protein 1